ncbi:MAG: acyl-[acyl-carrier-protein]--UDP-N-acetylglucosamine O-acyltransferase [Candidatus Marinimicrobia bacterium]|nr:acyl-[acyl-carrier-protein]--UDP-N-acetylglucosamine O-acyltransferase [Candidatus Neomarinimicrobiota bacterium]
MNNNMSVISKKAQIGKNVSIGPYCIIEDNVIIGDNTIIDSHTIIKEYTEVGENCNIFSHCVIGGVPQDKKYSGEKSKLVIGNNNTIREFCTLNRGTEESGITKIGNNCLFMAYVHVAHDCHLKNDIILANGVQLGGHVTIDNYGIIGGMTPVHQFCKIGMHSFIGGGLRVVQDVPPYIIANGEPLKFSGINILGLRRRKFSSTQRENIKKAYKLIYNSNYNISQATEKIQNTFNIDDSIKDILDFIKSSSRGLI